ncbi:hypothetical protein HDIA_3940 [Hartmannibacter diazotrophicus]|uniref:SH3b domain-containing protein n=1 Tax=Hartmannibacter diazotrophicus TaxID=1482074 RepID=A0A2C9DCM3_9HYPH|nr:SH3 domain-containing protein [Hartmannibacter diazotrophicus]SON57481.1 hypothetical protein HDIA_3940 [Hartmannibacter diazotrophicus]
MFKRLVLALALLATAPVYLASASTASAATPAVATANVNLRAGPSTAYPVVTVVPARAHVVTYGCLANYSWCDISLGTARGWVAAKYVQVVYQGAPVVVTAPVARSVGLAVVAFNKAYWDTYYPAYPWYPRWAAYPPYAVPPPYAPRVQSHSRSVQCVNGTCTGTRSTTGIYGGSANQTRQCANGNCTATRNVVGPYGGTASRTRNCSRGDASCSVTRTGPMGRTGTRTHIFGN